VREVGHVVLASGSSIDGSTIRTTDWLIARTIRAKKTAQPKLTQFQPIQQVGCSVGEGRRE